LNNIVEPESRVTILFNIVDNCDTMWAAKHFQSCFHQLCNNLIDFSRVANYTAKNAQPVTMLMKTSLNNIYFAAHIVPVVNNTVQQYCSP
jgi:hypothetical protein